MTDIIKIALLVLFIGIAPLPLTAQKLGRIPQKAIAKSVHYDVPSGYQQLGSTDLYYNIKIGGIDAGSVSIGSIDLIGKFGNQFYSSTYSDNGYVVAMHVEGQPAVFADCKNGTIVDGVVFSASIEPQGEMAKMVYTITNTNDSIDKIVSVGAYDDAYVGNTINASIAEKKDLFDHVYGISLSDRAGAQLCVIFGSGLVGVTGVDDYWYGSYSTNTSAEMMAGNYNGEYDSNYMVENGTYDCGIGWCWKNRLVQAGTSITLSYLIAIGDVNLEPNSSFEVTPEDPDGWNDLSRPHRLTLEGEYESPAGQNGKIQYSVEDSDEWLDLTDEIESGSTFTASLVAMFDANKENHTIRFRTMDAVGNTSMLTPIIYKDVSYHPVAGIEDKVYSWGDSIYQTNLTCDLPVDQYTIAGYRNNVNAGIATFNIEGVFPYSIGRKTYSYTINPLPLDGQILLEQNQFVYDGNSHCPTWSFSNDIFNTLEIEKDYTLLWSDNVVPGTAELRIIGKGNFSNEVAANFFIDKAQLRTDLYTVTLPNEDVTFDDNSHGASVSTSQGVGVPTIYYTPAGETSLSEVAPKDNGTYDIYVEFADGELYYGKGAEKIFTFTIYQFDETDWATLQAITLALLDRGWATPWDLSGGIVSASKLAGLTIEHGKVVGLDLSGASFSGQFPVELLALKNLGTLTLSNNSFEGAIETVAAYIQQNPGFGATITELNIANNSFSGNLGVMAACFPNLTSIDASGNHLSDIYPMISEKVVSLDVSGQTIDRTIDYNLSNTSIEDLAQQIPTILLYNHQTQSYTMPLNLQCSMEDGFGMTISYVNGHIAMSNVSDQNAYHGESGDVIDIIALNGDSSKANSSLKLKLMFEEGDANFNGQIDILDLQSAIAFMFDEYVNKPFNFTAANLWKDESINVQDAVCIVNKVLETLPNESRTKHKVKRINNEVESEYEATVVIADGQLLIHTDKPIAAFDIIFNNCQTIDLGPLQAIYNLEYTLKKTASGIRVIAYSLSGTTIPKGTHSIGNTDSESVSYAMLADAGANEITTSISHEILSNINPIIESNNIEILLDGIHVSTSVKEDLHCDIYNIQGECLLSATKTHPNGQTTIPFMFRLRQPYIIVVTIDGKIVMNKKILMTK